LFTLLVNLLLWRWFPIPEHKCACLRFVVHAGVGTPCSKGPAMAHACAGASSCRQQ
jgi:hypothetical protein